MSWMTAAAAEVEARPTSNERRSSAVDSLTELRTDVRCALSVGSTEARALTAVLAVSAADVLDPDRKSVV
jgi:hypothetical protein